MNKSNKLIYGILLSAFFFFISPSLYSSPNGKIPTSPAKTKVTKTIALEGGDYSSIDEAMSDIAEFGIADTLVLQLLDNSYSIFSFNINPAGPNRGTLIFESGSSDTINIEFESPGKSSSNNTLGGANGLYVYSDFLRSLKFIRVKLVASQFMSTLTSVVMEGAKVDFSLSGLQATGTEFNSPAGLDVYSLSDSCSFSFDNCTFTDVGSAGYTYGEYPYELTMTNCNFSFSYAGMWCENVGGNSFFENNIFRGDGIEGNGLTVYSSNSSVLGISDNEFDITSSGAIYVGFSSASPAKNLSGSHISSAKSSREKFRDNISQRKQQMKESRISRKQHSSTERTERVTALLTQPRTKHNLTRHPNAKELPTLNISNNTILNSGTDGIYVEYVENGDVVINGNSIQGNSFTGNGIYLPYFSGFGDNAPTVSVENNTISGFGNGMYTDGSEYAGDVSFSKNTIHGYGSIALELNDWTAFSMQVD
ncbi:MAG: right-handed parallel beta-helix repeat-containing protein, partial [Ignavibacteriales bacterium]|nr:right-handed parallel beta-helix repeat-containing protein [Ignavibacteriales bacterium]